MKTIIENLKTILIIAASIAAVWVFKDLEYQKAENIRQSENNRQIRMMDSLNFAQIRLTDKEIQEQLEYNNKSLLANLKEDKIEIRRLQRIVTQKQTYKDTSKVKTEFKGLAKAVVEGTPLTLPIMDSTNCWIMKGVIEFDGEDIFFEVTDREFKNVTDLVTFWERRQWKFLGIIKTRFLGKKQITVKVYNTCGQTETFIIENKKQLKK